MTPELEKFIAEATRSLGKRPEQQDEARGELMGRLSHRGVPVEQIDVSGPTARLESVRRLPDRWRRGLVLGVLLLLVGLLGFGVWRDASMLFRSIYASELVWRAHNPGFMPTSQWDRLFYDWLDERAPDLPVSGRQGDLEAYRRAHPEDLAALQEALLRRSIREADFMRPEERALIARLDSDNALWPALEMLWEFHKADGVELNSPIHRNVSPPPDPKAEACGWERFSEAVGLDRFESYGRILVRRQCEAYGGERGCFDGMVVSGLAGLPRTGSRFGRFWYGSTGGGFNQAVAKRIAALTGAKQPQELLKLFEGWKEFHGLLLAAPHPDPWALDALGPEPASMGSEFRSAFSRLGMTGPEERAQRIVDALNPSGSTPSLGYRTREEAGIRLMDASWRDVEVTAEEMRPGRKADIAMFQRMLVWVEVLIALGFVLLWGFEACRRSMVVKGMARQLTSLLTVRDHVWIGIFGIGLPWIYWWSVTRLTPVGIHDKIFEEEWVAVAWVLQLAIGLVLGLVMLTQVVHWRWAKAGGFLGLAGHVPWLGWVVAGLVAASLPASGMLRFLSLTSDDEQAFYLLGCAAMGSLGLLWLLWVGILNLCTLRSGALRPNLMARTMIPWSLAGLTTLLLAVGVLHFAEAWWYRRDPLLPSWTSEHYTNALEERGVMKRVEPLRKAFGVAPTGEP